LLEIALPAFGWSVSGLQGVDQVRESKTELLSSFVPVVLGVLSPRERVSSERPKDFPVEEILESANVVYERPEGP